MRKRLLAAALALCLILSSCAGAKTASSAAGDVTSGFEGATHQSGDCLTMVLYYGKVAGEQAAANE